MAGDVFRIERLDVGSVCWQFKKGARSEEESAESPAWGFSAPGTSIEDAAPLAIQPEDPDSTPRA